MAQGDERSERKANMMNFFEVVSSEGKMSCHRNNRTQDQERKKNKAALFSCTHCRTRSERKNVMNDKILSSTKVFHAHTGSALL